jgi:hypothetical protein
MYQDIQTFSDITAIDTTCQLVVELSITFHGHTKQQISLNEINIVAPYTRALFDLFSPIDLSINLLEFDEGTSGVEVELSVNGLNVLPKYQHVSSKQTNYIDKLGIWKMEIPANFYTWYHAISGQGFIA